MKNNELRGFKAVFNFTLSQTLKQKSFIISFVILFLIALGAPAVMKIKDMGKDDVEKSVAINKIYYESSEAGFDVPLEEAKSEFEYMSDIEFIKVDDKDATLAKLDGENVSDDDAYNNAILVTVKFETEEGFYFALDVHYSKKGMVKESDVQTISADLGEWFTTYKVAAINASDAALDSIKSKVETNVFEYDDYVKEKKAEPITMSQYTVVYSLMVIFYMLIVLSAALAGAKVAEEKTNKIVEYLMTNIRPMALVLGKIVAGLVVSVSEMILVFGGAIGSYFACEAAFPSENGTLLDKINLKETVSGLGVVGVIVCLVVLIFGIFFYGLISGLFSATVSKIEDLQQGNMMFNVLIMVSFIACIAGVSIAPSLGINAFVKFLCIFPLTSFMMLPGVLLIGGLSVIEVCLALVLQVLAIILVLWFVARVYESVIVASGKIVSIPDMIRMAKRSKGKEAN